MAAGDVEGPPPMGQLGAGRPAGPGTTVSGGSGGWRIGAGSGDTR